MGGPGTPPFGARGRSSVRYGFGSVTLKINTQHTHWEKKDHHYGWGVRVRRHLANAEGVLYGMELGSVTLKINNQHTHCKLLEIHNCSYASTAYRAEEMRKMLSLSAPSIVVETMPNSCLWANNVFMIQQDSSSSIAAAAVICIKLLNFMHYCNKAHTPLKDVGNSCLFVVSIPS